MLNVLLIGLGQHARRVQLPILLHEGKTYNACIKAVVDLASQESIVKTYIEQNGLGESVELLLLDKELTSLKDGELHKDLVYRLDRIVQKHEITAVFICTEPIYHASYAKWALMNAIHVLMDKPISAPLHLATSNNAVNQIIDDYRSLVELYTKQKRLYPGLIFELMSQRRYHPAFHEIDRLIQEVKELSGVPITSFQSIHCDGKWRMPDEIVDMDYHPYNQGYGKCLHSGYHLIDITNWLVLRSYGKTHSLKDIEVFSNFVYPSDFLAQLPLENYNKLFDNFDRYRNYPPEVLAQKYAVFGEIDAHISTAYKDENNRSLTIGQLGLLHNSFAQRAWPTSIGRDLYKGNGRVRHEVHYFVQGPFQTLCFQSLKSEEILNEQVNHSNVGGEYHLDIHVFRNSKLFPQWKAYEKISLKDLPIHIIEGSSRGHQGDARRAAVLTFLKSIQEPETVRYADLYDQYFSIGLLGAAYRSALYRKRGLDPLARVKDELQSCSRFPADAVEAKI